MRPFTIWTHFFLSPISFFLTKIPYLLKSLLYSAFPLKKKNHNYPLSVFSVVCQHHGERIGIHISVFSLLLAECFSERSYLKKHLLNTYVKGCVQELFTTRHFTCFPLWIEWSKAFSLSCDIHIWNTSGVHQTEIM